jgi:LmbE family N-acetylglucosaminyl deacetylase
MTQWIYLSPHFDDVVLSAGGLVWEQARRGDTVQIWTICAGDPPFDKPLTDYAAMLHTFWELGDEVPRARSQEDAACCEKLGAAAYRRYTVPDNIYRYYPGTDEPVVKVPDDNFGPSETDEPHLFPPVADFLRKNVPPGWELVSPLGVGGHRDHKLTRRAAEQLGIPLWHYVDYPYAIQSEFHLEEWVPAGAECYTLPINPAGLKGWQDGFACHRSQINLFWADEAEMRASIQAYLEGGGGFTLYKF